MAVVRVKRSCSEEPLDALLLACKRRKTEDDHLTSIFKFAATVSDQKENVSEHISKAFSSSEAKSNFKTPNITNITDRLRAENKLFSQNSRLKVVNCFRALNESDNLDDSDAAVGSDSGLTIVDIESLPTTDSDNGETNSSTAGQDDASSKYVYDIYYALDCKLDKSMLDNPISCHALDSHMFEDYANDTYNDEEESDDSNDENNWRNDYPDEDPDSIGEDDMKLAFQMGDLNMGETNSLSSDDGEEALVYGLDDPDYQANINPQDVHYFGHDYASFKRRVLQDLDSDDSENSDFCYGDSDLESDRL